MYVSSTTTVYVTSFAKPAIYAHYGKEQFSLSVDSSINKLTSY